MSTRHVLFGFAALLFLHHAAAAQSACTREKLSKQPRWISTLELNPTTNEILIADPKAGELVAYNVRNGEMRTLSVPDQLPPSSITKIDGGFLIKDREDAVVLGANGKALGTKLNLRQTKTGGVTGLGSLYSNWVTRGSTFLGYGAVMRADLANSQYDPSRGFQLGFVRGRVSTALGEFSNVELLEATEDNDLYLLGFPYFAANEEGLFFVRMVGSRAAIMRVQEPGAIPLAELPAFPDRYRAVPKLGPNQGPSTTAPRFAQIEKERMVVGLFGQGRYLYLLAREPDTGQGRQWLLYQISPNKPKPTGVLRLPTTAHHLSVVPGPGYWYLFERGVVKGWGDQEIKSVVRVPTAWITSPANSPLSDSRLAACKSAD